MPCSEEQKEELLAAVQSSARDSQKSIVLSEPARELLAPAFDLFSDAETTLHVIDENGDPALENGSDAILEINESRKNKSSKPGSQFDLIKELNQISSRGRNRHQDADYMRLTMLGGGVAAARAVNPEINSTPYIVFSIAALSTIFFGTVVWPFGYFGSRESTKKQSMAHDNELDEFEQDVNSEPETPKPGMSFASDIANSTGGGTSHTLGTEGINRVAESSTRRYDGFDPDEMQQGDQPLDDRSNQSDGTHPEKDSAAKPGIRVYAETGRRLQVTTSYILMDQPDDLLVVDEMPGFSLIIVDSPPLVDGEIDLRNIELLQMLVDGGYTIDISGPVFRENSRMEQRFTISKAGEADVTFLLRGDEGAVARQITWVRMVSKYASSLGAEARQTMAYGTLNEGREPVEAMSEDNISLSAHDHAIAILLKPNFRVLTINLGNVSGTKWQHGDTRRIILFELLMAGFSVEILSDFHYDKGVYVRTVTMYSKQMGYFIIEIRGEKGDVDQIIKYIGIENSKYGPPPQNRDEDRDEPDVEDVVNQCHLMNDRLLEEKLLKNEITVVRTPPTDECDIQIQKYSSAPSGKIELHIRHNTVNFPDDPLGNFEIILEKTIDDTKKTPKIDIPDSGSLRLISKQIDEKGLGSVTYTNDNQRGKFFSITLTNKNEGNTETLLSIENKIREQNKLRFEAYTSYAGPFMDAEFEPNPSTNGTYDIDSSKRPLKIHTDNANDVFRLNAIEHDVNLVVGEYVPTQSIPPFVRPRPNRQCIIRHAKKPLMFDGPWLREDATNAEAETTNYARHFKERDSGADFIISAKDSSAKDAVDNFADNVESCMKEKEEEFKAWMVRLSIGGSAFQDAKSIVEFNSMVNGIPGWAYNKAISFYKDKAGEESKFVAWGNTHGVQHVRFDIARSALIVFRNAGSPGWGGLIDWESTPIPKESKHNPDNLYRSRFVPKTKDGAIPTDWNWHARTWDAISINESSVEYAIENWTDLVDGRASARKIISSYYKKLIGEIKDDYYEDARKILYLLDFLNTDFPDGTDPQFAIDRSKRIFTKFNKAMELGRLEQAPVREELLNSL